MDKKKIVRNIVIISIIVVIIGIFVVSYAMFFNTSNSDNSTKLGNLDVEYVDGEEIKVENLLPINSDEVEEKANVFNFSVENKGNSYAYYDIKLVDIDLPLALKDENFKWKLLSNDELINEGNFHELANTKDYLKRSIGIPIKEIQEYKLMIWIENSNDIDQSYMLNRNGSFKIQIEARQKLASSPKDEITVISNTTNGNLVDLKIYGNTIDGKNVGDNKIINITVSQNLLDNGLGETGDNRKFSQLTYSDEKYKSLGSFYISNSKRNDLILNNDISIINDYYYLNICAKSSNLDAIYYFGIREHDIDKKGYIDCYDFGYQENTLTYLTHDLKDGDEYIYLNDVSNYNTYPPHIIFWNYIDSRGYKYPVGTYSKNAWPSLYTNENIDKENSRIKLNTPWNHGTFIKGTKVSKVPNAGLGTYNYILHGNSKITTEYVCYNKIAEGIYGSNDNISNVNNKFRSGVKFIEFLILNNFNNTPNTTTYYSRFIIRKNENIQNITIDISGHEPLRSIDDTRDYIDYKNKRIVRLINSDGTKKNNPEYEPITLPEIKTYDGNTIIESSDNVSPLFQAQY